MAQPDAMSDADLFERSDAVPSVDAALGTFVVEHYERLLRLGRLVCRDAADAGDAVQIGLEQPAARSRLERGEPRRPTGSSPAGIHTRRRSRIGRI
jgi:DNA-directed RNA polymerase specialized sigma24 family protein